MHMVSILIFLLFSTPGDTWTEFRGPNGSGIAPATCKPPTTWSEKENIRWKTAIHGKGWSCPVIWGSQVWLTTATEDGTELSVLCLDKDSGKVLRDEILFHVAKPQF